MRIDKDQSLFANTYPHAFLDATKFRKYQAKSPIPDPVYEQGI